MISETLNEIYKRIESSGKSGLKRTQLIKEFGKDATKRLEELLSQGLIYAYKKNNRIIYLSKNYYKSDNNSIDTNGDNITDRLSNEIMKISKRLSYIENLELSIREQDKKISSLLEMLKKISSMESILDGIRGIDSSTISSLSTRLDSLESNHQSFTNDISSKIDGLAKEIDGKIDTKLVDIENKIGTLSNSIDQKADSNRLSSLEKRLDDSIDKVKSGEQEVSKMNDELSNVKKELASIAATHSSLVSKIDKLGMVDERLKEMEKSILMIREELDRVYQGNGSHSELPLEQFKIEFDRILADNTSSIGWIELADVRKKICTKYGISKHAFYSLLNQVIDNYNDMYELSSGGEEGVIIRGLVHGFIRRI